MAIEFAYVAPLMVFVMMAVLELGYAINVKTVISQDVKNSIAVASKRISFPANSTLDQKKAVVYNYLSGNMTEALARNHIENNGSLSVDIQTIKDINGNDTTKALVSATYLYKPFVMRAAMALVPNPKGQKIDNNPSFTLNTTQIIDLSFVKSENLNSGLSTQQLSEMFPAPDGALVSNTNNIRDTIVLLVSWGQDQNLRSANPYHWARLFTWRGNDILPANLIVNVRSGTLFVKSPYFQPEGGGDFFDTKIPYVWVVSALGYSNVMYVKYNATFGSDSNRDSVLNFGDHPNYERNVPIIYNPNDNHYFYSPLDNPGNNYNGLMPYYYRINPANYYTPPAILINGANSAQYFLDLYDLLLSSYGQPDLHTGADTVFTNIPGTPPDPVGSLQNMATAGINEAKFFLDNPGEFSRMENANNGNPAEANDSQFVREDLQKYAQSLKGALFNDPTLYYFHSSYGYRWCGTDAVAPAGNTGDCMNSNLTGTQTVQELALRNTVKAGWRGSYGFDQIGTSDYSREITMWNHGILQHYTTYVPAPYDASAAHSINYVNIYQPIVPFYVKSGQDYKTWNPNGLMYFTTDCGATDANNAPVCNEIDPAKLSDPAGPFYETFKWKIILDGHSGQYDRLLTSTYNKYIDITDVYLDNDGDGIPNAWDDDPIFFDVNGDGVPDGMESDLSVDPNNPTALCSVTSVDDLSTLTPKSTHTIYSCDTNTLGLGVSGASKYIFPIWGTTPIVSLPFTTSAFQSSTSATLNPTNADDLLPQNKPADFAISRDNAGRLQLYRAFSVGGCTQYACSFSTAYTTRAGTWTNDGTNKDLQQKAIFSNVMHGAGDPNAGDIFVPTDSNGYPYLAATKENIRLNQIFEVNNLPFGQTPQSGW